MSSRDPPVSTSPALGLQASCPDFYVGAGVISIPQFWSFIPYKEYAYWAAEEIAQWLRMLTALLEDMSSVPNIHIRWFSAPHKPSSKGIQHSGYHGHTHIHVPLNDKDKLKKKNAHTGARIIAQLCSVCLASWILSITELNLEEKNMGGLHPM